MATTEIEKLERRYAENPQGLTFAPLAEVHRKNGDISRALELLKAGLELHPNYIPASIVLGRCHWDQGDLPAAEAAFSHVLRLDDENVIALKSLADINERLERFGDAQRWLNRLISVDRSNEEARQQLARIEAAKRAASKPPLLRDEIAPVPSKPAAVAPPAEPEPPMDLAAAVEAAVASVQPTARSEPKSPALEFLDISEPVPPSPEPSQIQLEDKADSSPEAAPVDGLISQEFVPPKDATYRSHPELTQDFVSSKDPIDRLEVETAGEVELHSSGASEFRVPNAAEDFMEAPPHPAPAAELDLIRPEPVAEPTPEPLPAAIPASQPKRPSYSVRVTGGQSVAAFFQTMLAARPQSNASSSTPTRSEQSASGTAEVPVQEHFEPSSPAGENQSSPAVPAPGPAPELAVSFDDFFGAPAGGSGNLPKGNPDPGKDDLDQFQSWLQNLKR